MATKSSVHFARLGAAIKHSKSWWDNSSEKQRNVCLYSIVIVVVVMLWIPRMRGAIDLRWDAGVYYQLGASLASGEGYRIGSEPGAPVGVQYPPGLPALVAVHILLLGTDHEVVGQALRITYACLFLTYCLSLLTLARRYLPDLAALVATLISILQVNTLLMSDFLFTELPFALLGVWLMLLIHERHTVKQPILRDGLAFLLAGCGFMLRSAGVVLLVAWPLSALIRREWRRFGLTAALAAIPIIGWQWHVKVVQQSSEYTHPAYSYQRAPYQYYNVPYLENLLLVDSFQPELGTLDVPSIINRVASNVLSLPNTFGETVSTVFTYWHRIIAVTQDFFLGKVYTEGHFAKGFIYLIGLMAIAGLAQMAARGLPIAALIVLGSSALVCVTPWPSQFGRYLMPITPFLAIGYVFVVRNLIDWISGRIPSPVPVRLILTSLLLALPILMQAYTIKWLFTSTSREVDAYGQKTPNLFYYDDPWRNWDRAMAWIAEHASNEGVVATSASHLCHLKTGHLAVLPPMEADPIKAGQLMQEVPIRFVVVDELDFLDTVRRYAMPAIEAAPDQWNLVYETGETQIFEFKTWNKNL